MGSWFSFIPVLMQFLASLPGLIQTAEHAFSGKPGSGEAKKELVTGIVNEGLKTYQSVVPKEQQLPEEQVQAIQNTVDTVIDTTVDVMNTAKVIMGKQAIVEKKK
jgi:hypothetical protein